MTVDNVKTIEPYVGPVDQPPEPMEVQVRGKVETVDAEQRYFRTGAAVMSNAVEAVVVLGANPKRREGAIINNSTELVYLLDSSAGSTSEGYPLLPNGGGLGISHQAAVYAKCPTASAALQVSLNYAVEVAR